jgi:hypothetical protein
MADDREGAVGNGTQATVSADAKEKFSLLKSRRAYKFE